MERLVKIFKFLGISFGSCFILFIISFLFQYFIMEMLLSIIQIILIILLSINLIHLFKRPAISNSKEDPALESDNSVSRLKNKTFQLGANQQEVGVFWDYENVRESSNGNNTPIIDAIRINRIVIRINRIALISNSLLIAWGLHRLQSEPLETEIRNYLEIFGCSFVY